jgi:hypothetical protein
MNNIYEADVHYNLIEEVIKKLKERFPDNEFSFKQRKQDNSYSIYSSWA